MISYLVRVLAVSLVIAGMVSAFPQGAPRPVGGGEPRSNGYTKDNYFQYINVPKEKVFEWGYRRGNDPNHFREEYLSQNHHAFKAKVKWGDQYGGYGEHFYDYNHVPKYEHHEPSYKPPGYKPVYESSS